MEIRRGSVSDRSRVKRIGEVQFFLNPKLRHRYHLRASSPWPYGDFEFYPKLRHCYYPRARAFHSHTGTSSFFFLFPKLCHCYYLRARLSIAIRGLRDTRRRRILVSTSSSSSIILSPDSLSCPSFCISRGMRQSPYRISGGSGRN